MSQALLGNDVSVPVVTAPPAVLVEKVNYAYTDVKKASSPNGSDGSLQARLRRWLTRTELKQVLFDTDLRLMPGEIVILTGGSGSGKTTLLTLIGGLRTMQAGNIRIHGHELKGLTARQLVGVRRRIGFIFQMHNLVQSLTASQNVELALELNAGHSEQRRRRARELLTRVGLGEHCDQKPRRLSGGQQQRVAIARALANDPKLILADEPTSALDEESGLSVVEQLEKLATDAQLGSACLIVTHDPRILRFATRLVRMEKGKIVSDRNAREFLQTCEYLQRCWTFTSSTPRMLTVLAEKMRPERFAAGAVIIRKGELGDKFYLIRHGSARVDRGADSPEPRFIDLVPPQFFGERALITDQPRNATVMAREDLDVYTLAREDFKAALDMSRDLNQEIWRVYAERG
jgi:putative ABC transport system ATP-binding protein